MNLKFVKVRFNLDKEADRKAMEILQGSELSNSKFIIGAINAYASYLSKDEEKKRFLQQIIETIRVTIRQSPGIALAELFQGHFEQRKADISETATEESGKIADDFLESFN